MNLQHLRYVSLVVQCGYNVSDAARQARISQSGVSKGVAELEDALGFKIFQRQGKRLTGLTEIGGEVMSTIDDILLQAQGLKRIGDDFVAERKGRLSIAATHTQARYRLPNPVIAFRKAYPDVTISIHQGTPEQIAQWLLNGQADVGIATESLSDVPGLATLPCYEWEHCLFTPSTHPLATIAKPTLAQLAEHPLVTYDPAFTGRKRIDKTFYIHGLEPTIALEAIDSDVLKTYVHLELGAGLIAEMAISETDRKNSHVVGLGYLFGRNTTRIAVRRGAHLRRFVLHFIATFAPQHTPLSIEQELDQHA